MNRWWPVIRDARGSLFVLASAIVLGGALIFGSSYFDEYLFGNFAQNRNQSKAKRAQLTERQQQLDFLQAHADRFRAIEAQDLTGTASREEWVQQLLTSRKQLGLPDTLTYTLKAPVPLPQSGGGAAAAGASGGRPFRAAAVLAPNDTPLAHDLEFELRDTHEDELLALLNDFQARIRHRFRVQSCEFSLPGARGLTVQCTLRFFSLPQPASPAQLQAGGRPFANNR